MKLPFVPDHDERLAAVGRFFDASAATSDRRAILDRYDVKSVLLPKGHFDDWPARLHALEALGTSVFSSPDYELLEVTRATPGS
jgi:hypothetical protein